MTAALREVRPFFVGGEAVRRAWGLELALWMVVLIWAGNYIVGKIGMREFLPQIFTCLRFAIATPLMYLVLFWREGKLSFGQVPWGRCLLVGAVGVAIYQTLFIAALKYTTATTVALMLGLSPISTAFVAAFLGYERLRRQMVAGCLLALLGLIFVLGAAGGSWGFREETLFGDMLALAAGGLWGVYPVLMLPILQRGSGLWATCHTSLAGTLLLLAATAGDLWLFPWETVTLAGWGARLYAAIPVTVISLLLWYYGIERLGSNQVMVYMYLVTPLALLLAVWLLGEQLSWLQGLGAVLVLAGVFLAKRQI